MMQQIERYRHKFVVRRAAEKIEREQTTASVSVTPPAPAPATAPARASNSTSTRSNIPPARATIPALVVNVDLGALPLPEKKTRRTPHQVQVERENKKKRASASVNNLATSRATTLLSEERKKPKSEQRSAKMICDQVENEFKARKKNITLSANTINIDT